MPPAKTTGKLAMKTVKTGVPSPVPNQSMASTSQAMGGVPSSTVIQGRAIYSCVRFITCKKASATGRGGLLAIGLLAVAWRA